MSIEHREPTPTRQHGAPPRRHDRLFRRWGQARSGRNFAVTDHSESPFVVVVNETLARRYWPGVSPIGTRVRLGGNATIWREVVGIVSDVKHWGFDRPVNPEMYLPQKQMVWDGLTFVLATIAIPRVTQRARALRAARRSAALEMRTIDSGGAIGAAREPRCAARDIRWSRGRPGRRGPTRDGPLVTLRSSESASVDARRAAGRVMQALLKEDSSGGDRSIDWLAGASADARFRTVLYSQSRRPDPWPGVAICSTTLLDASCRPPAMRVDRCGRFATPNGVRL